MKNLKLYVTNSTLFCALILFAVSCKKPSDPTPDPGAGAIQGTPGNPRFNLQFTNKENVDLDLHVLTPMGNEIYFSNPSADGGQLDVDCACGSCPNGANENIYWVPGTAPHGQYKVWVKYYGSCGATNASSTFTLRILNQNSIIQTYTGTLSNNQESNKVSFTF